MTMRLYDLDSHQTETESSVVSCTPAGDQFDVVLDQTVFFPEGGGQPSDTGTLGEANVLHVREEEGVIYHRVDRALSTGAVVSGKIDWARRFDLMQQHTGEHLLSFSFYELFSASNVGFHLALDYATIDFDKPVSHEQIMEAELLANRFVWKNLPVIATFYDSEDEVRALPLRKHAEGLVPPIRIVGVEGADLCTCCAPHCTKTGEIGSIFVADASNYKGGTRITFFCGERALKLHRAQHDDLDVIARRFSCQREAAVGAVKKLSDDYGSLKKNERDLAKSLNGYMSAELLANAAQAGKFRVVTRLLSGVDATRLKDLAQTASAEKTLALLLSECDGRLLYVLSTGAGFPLDVSELMPAVNAALGGKGGGRSTLAQGTSPTISGSAEALEQIKSYFVKRLSNQR
ncbi:MAG: alanine--tRNA ligase-related protein [Christensenella sp.]|nr:alanine--tRNA ligase-related protein [Christensenella sp.]